MGQFGAAGGLQPQRQRGLWVSAWPVASLRTLSAFLHLLPETPFIHLLNRDVGHCAMIRGQALLAARCVDLLT